MNFPPGKGTSGGGFDAAARRRRQLLSSYVTGAFGLGINAMVVFLLPLRASELGVSLGIIGVLVGAKALVEAVLSVPLGAVVDRIGARRAFILGAGLSALVSIGFAVAASPWGLLAASVALGVVRPLGWIGAQTYVASLGGSQERSYHTGRFSFTSNIGQIVAPLLAGGVAQLTGYGVAFIAVAGYAGGFALVGLTLPRSMSAPARKESRTGSGLSAALRLMGRRGIQVAMLLTFVRLWVPRIWTAFFPLMLVREGMPEVIAGTAVSGMAGVATLMALTAGRLSRRTTPEIVTATALGASAIGLAVSPLWQFVPGIYVPAVLVGIGQGLSLPLLITIVSETAPSEQRGLALGLRSSVNQAASAAGPAAGGPLIGALGVASGFGAGSAVALALLGWAVLAHLGHRKSSATEGGVEG